MPNRPDTITIDFGSPNLKALVITNSLVEVERIKGKGEVGVWFGPDVAEFSRIQLPHDFYVIGILEEPKMGGNPHHEPTNTITVDPEKRTIGGTFRIQRGERGDRNGMLRATVEIADMTPLDMAGIQGKIEDLARDIIFYLCHMLISQADSDQSVPS